VRLLPIPNIYVMEAAPLTDQETLAEAKEFAERLAASLPDIIPVAGLTLKSKLPFKALSIRELLIHRVSELASSAVENFERGRTVAAIALTRGVIETVAVLFALHERVERFLEDKNVDELDAFLMRTLMGSRTNGDLPVAANILTLIDRLHLAVEGTRTTYDALCEITHPNWAGLLGSFGELDRQAMELRLGATGRSRGMSAGVNALSGALMTFQHYYNELAGLIGQLNEHFETRTK